MISYKRGVWIKTCTRCGKKYKKTGKKDKLCPTCWGQTKRIKTFERYKVSCKWNCFKLCTHIKNEYRKGRSGDKLALKKCSEEFCPLYKSYSASQGVFTILSEPAHLLKD